MNFIEALKEVRNSKLVSRKSWFDNIALSISSKSDEIDDWVIKNYKRSLTFFEAFKEIKNGKKVRRKSWFDGSYINGDTPLNCLKIDDLLANDWEIVE